MCVYKKCQRILDVLGKVFFLSFITLSTEWECCGLFTDIPLPFHTPPKTQLEIIHPHHTTTNIRHFCFGRGGGRKMCIFERGKGARSWE